MADIRQAIAWLETGNRIRRAVWSNGTYITMDDQGNIIQTSKSIAHEGRSIERVSSMWPTQAVLANDWEVYNDPPRFNEGDLAYLPLTVVEVNGTGKTVCVYLHSQELWMDANSLLTYGEMRDQK